MALKFTLIVLACAAQVFAQQSSNTAAQCPPTEVESAQEIAYDFESIIDEFNEIRDAVSIVSADAYFRGVKPEVVFKCMKEQRENYIKLGKYISKLTVEASKKLAESMGSSYENFRNAVKSMMIIAKTVRELPNKVMNLIQKLKFIEAVEVMKESRRIVEENARIFAVSVAELRKEMPQVAEEAIEMSRFIRDEARKGSQEISKAFRICIEEGSKNPTNENENEDEDEEIDISED